MEVVQFIGGDNISTCRGITSVQWRDNISTVEGIQYSGRRILISACLVINNDEMISKFCITIRNFNSEVF